MVVPRWIALAGLIAIFLLIAFVRLRLASIPLERDEGEYAYAGQLILEGEPPYLHAVNMKFPGTYLMYAAIMAILGQTPWAIRAGLLVVNGLSALAIFVTARRVAGSVAGFTAGATYLILSAGAGVLGLYAHATHFVVLYAALAFAFIVECERPRPRWSALAGGIAMAMAVLMKQHAIFFIPPALVALVPWNDAARWKRAAREIAKFAAGALIPAAVVVIWLRTAGVWERFRFWTFDYARKYVGIAPVEGAFHRFSGTLSNIVLYAPWLWLLAAVGIAVLLAYARLRSRAPQVLLFVAAAFMTVVPGLYFREHYFITFLPAVALLCGCAVAGLEEFGRRHHWNGAIPAAVAVMALGSAIWTQRAIFFTLSPESLARLLGRGNPSTAAIEIANTITSITTPSETVAVLGSEPEIYFYSHRRSATSYIYAYPLVEAQPYAAQMQRDAIQEIDKADPRAIVIVQAQQSWLTQPGADRSIFAWSEKKLSSGNYELVEIVETTAAGDLRLASGTAASTFRPEGDNVVMLFRRRT
jgi:4-amino-4-deoxy-L-arabinose transferase-like glycosyltransferase